MTRPLDDAPDDVLERARFSLRAEQDRITEEERGRRLAKRLIVSTGIILVGTIACLVALPMMGVYLPPAAVLVIITAIAAGAIMAHVGDHAGVVRRPKPPAEDEGCAVGCCPGPRPLRSFREPPQR